VPATNQQKHKAGRHLVVAEALLRGYDAHPVGRSGLVEIRRPSGGGQGDDHGRWQIGDICRFAEATIQRIVFVDVTETGPDFYIMDGDEARETLKRNFDQWEQPPGQGKAAYTR
jgi:hypothetical protein